MKPDPRDLLGPVCGAFAGYATDEALREGAASGGFATAFLAYLLENNLIDGALVSQTIIKDGRLSARSYIAQSKQELLDARTSIYMAFPYLEGLKPLLERPMRIAIVGLPCQIQAVRRWEQRHPEAKGEIVWRIGLFCSKGALPELVHAYMRRHAIAPGELKRFYFRKGQWKARVVWEDVQGRTHSAPYMSFSFYNNLYIQQPPQCLACADALAMEADISCGDAWLPHLKPRTVGHSLVIPRTDEAAAQFARFCDSGAFEAAPVELGDVAAAQRRTLVKKLYFPIAAQRLGPLFGYRVQPRGGLRPRWNHYLGAALVMLSMRLGRNRRITDLIFRLPRWTLYPYMALLKAFMSF